MQLQLLQWIRFYKLLNEMPMTDRPSDEVFEDDELCDRWYDAYLRQLAHESGKARKAPEGFELPSFTG